MPAYDYECKECNHNFEVFQAMSEPALEKCPECGGKINRIITGGAGIIFKGSGFYINDSKSGSKTTAKSSNTKDKAANDSKSEKPAAKESKESASSEKKGKSGNDNSAA